MSSTNDPNDFLSPCAIYIVDSGVIRARMNIFENGIRKYGGRFVKNPSSSSSITHILVDDDLAEEFVAKILSNRLPNYYLFSDDDRRKDDGRPELLRTKWLSACLKQKKLVDSTPFRVELLAKIEEEKPVETMEEQKQGPSPSKDRRRRHPSTDSKEDSKEDKGIYDQTTDEELTDDDDIAFDRSRPSSNGSSHASPSGPKKPRFACEQASNDPSNQRINHNEEITKKLAILAEGYKSTNDKWRALSYEKAIKTLSTCPKEISSYEEVLAMRGIGKRLADKIWEIHQSGELRKADEFLHDDKVRTMNMFTNIFGVGPTIAEQWYAQGHRTLKDLEEKVHLTNQQRLGLKYYDEIQMRMDRSEAAELGHIVIQAVKKLDSDFICTPGGSFRRGCKTCGDIDFILTHPDGHSHRSVIPILVKDLTESGFLTDHLVEMVEEGNQKKYMGLCKLPGEDKKNRRIDIIAVPYSEYGSTLVYFTGSMYFVRSIYSKAKSMGMRLNQHGLRGGVMRQGKEKLNDGYLIPTPTEESVFESLGIPYRKPEERDLISFTADL